MAKAISKQHDGIHADLYDKVNACTVAVTRLTSELKSLKTAMAAETDRYVDLVRRAQDRQFRVSGCLVLLVIFCVGIIGYGAIGRQGMYTVRNTLPTGGTPVIDVPYIPNSDRDTNPVPYPQGKKR